MNKSELVAEIAKQSKLTKKDSETALNAFIDSVEKTLKKGEKIALVGFGNSALGNIADKAIITNNNDYGEVEDTHLAYAHTISKLIKERKE